MKKFIQRLVPLCALLCMTSFSFVSRAEFDIYDYYDSPLSAYGPGVRKLNDRSWTSSSNNSNYFSDWNQYFKVNPDWDPLNPSSASMYLWGPNSLRITNSKVSGTNYIAGSSFVGAGYYRMENMSFNQRATASGKDGQGTVIKNTDLLGTKDTKDGMFEIASSAFNDKTSIQTTARVSDSGGVGTQINSSTFNDDTSISVADGGLLEINDSVINLANENIMEQYLGKNSFLFSALNSIYQRVYVLFVILATDGWSSGLTDVSATDLKGNTFTYRFPTWIMPIYTYNRQTESISFTYKEGNYALWSGLRVYMRDCLPTMFTSYMQLFASWFYPLKDQAPLYWRFYNTDTGKSEEANIAGVLYNITWYLGELYKTNDWEAGSGFDDARDKIEDLTDNMHSAETGITNTVLPNIQNFAPDPSEITSLSALSFIGDYLQKIYVALGAFAVPITLSLVLAVCMQLVGYFKYKR